MARSMAPLYDGHDYYKRMLELQEKLRKSEEERIRLEERFNILVRESRNRHDVCINRLRMRYIEYLEEQRTKDERNHKLLAALDKVMNKLALISAKKDRLNVLRKQYEAYLLRAYANYRPPGSITGDSGIASQNEEKNTKKTTMIHPDLTSTEMKRISSPRMYSEAPDHQSNQPRSTSPSKFHEQINISLKNPPISATTLNVDHRRTNVPSGSHVYVPISNQYSQIPSSVPNNLQHIPDVRVSYAEAPALSMASSDNVQPHIAPVNRFFREHVESAQAVSGFPTTARYPIGDTTRYEETSRHQFDPLLQYRDANVLTSDSGRKEYDSAAVGPTLVTGKSSTYRIGSDANVANQIGPLPGYMDYVLTSSQRSDDERSSRSITSDDLDGLIRRNERLLWSKADIAATSRGSPEGDVNFDENGMTAIVEDELDRYISNIRKLHREHGVQNLEEQDHEQNTSGDLLNVSLSEDPLEPSAENRARKERVSEEMNKVLALANDLASRTNPEEILRDSKRNNSFTEDKIESCETKNDASRSKDERKAEEYVTSVKNEIKNDVAASLTKSELPHIDTQIMKENQDNVDDSADRKISATKKDNINEAINDSRNELKEKFDLAIGEESNIENVFEAAEELAPWDIASVQKKVCELRLDDSEEDQAAEKCAEDRMNEEISNGLCNSLRSTEQNEADGEVENASSSETKVLPHLETEAKTIDTSEASEEQNKIHESKHEDAENESPKVLSQNSANESEIAAQSGEQLIEVDGNERRKQANDEDTEVRVDDQSGDLIKDSEYNVEQGYVEDPSQAQQYEQQDLNQQYYDQNMPYEAGNEEYEQEYADQGYAQEGQEYVEYVDSQYEQYPEDVNNQQYQHYSNEQYEQDPNQTYDYNYDPNQGYEDSGRQYDPNQGYENHPETQAYEYTEEVSYEPNQTYEQEYKEKQRDPEDDTAKKPETEEVSRKQADQDLNQKSNEDKSQQDVVNEVNQSRKKDVIKSLLDSDTDTTIERNVSNTESDFDFN